MLDFKNATRQDRIGHFNNYLIDTHCDYIIKPDMVQWLVDIGYFDTLASISHHLNYSGGLYEHSYHVATKLREISNKMGLSWRRPQSPEIIGLLHDVCKCDDYIWAEDRRLESLDHVVFGIDGHWEYKPTAQKMYDGHGVKSVLMVAPWIQLSAEEVRCIRFHMATYTENKDEWNRYNLAIQKYPNVLWTHTADNYAAQVMEATAW